MKNLSMALKKWKNLLGKKNVLTNYEEINRTQTTTFYTFNKVLAVIKPKIISEVQESVRVANDYKIPIYPVSTGKNWGYGSQAPTVDNCVVMELKALRRILNYNEKLGYVTVEPGVTFLQLHNFLHKKKSNLVVSNMGGSPDSSLIGNFIERGIGRGLYGNKYNYGCNLEVVLSTGEIIKTGDNNFSRTKVGPDIMGLFTQSNLGIVIKMTFWLAPKPKYFQTLLFYLENTSVLEKLIDVIRILTLETTIKGNLLIANDFRTLVNLEQYPWDKAKGQTPLPEKILQELKRKWKMHGVWNGKIFFYASNKTEMSAQRQRVKETFGKIKGIAFFFNEKEYKDIPSDLAIKSLYWRKRQPIPKKMDPDRDGCGVIWISPTVPFIGKDVLVVIKIMNRIMSKYQYELNIGINCITDRKIYITGAIIYDRNIKGEDRKALLCYDEIYHELINKKYIPYRLSIHSMSKMPNPTKSYVNFVKKLKKTFDPNDIIAPGRYDFRTYWED